MLSYSLDGEDKLPLYENLYRCLREDIRNGKLRAGERLPSRRAFAANLGVSSVTVENAYLQLEAEGYIRAWPRKGYYVENIGDLLPERSREIHINTPEKHTAPTVFADLTGSGAGTDEFPFSIWSKLMRELLSGNRGELMKRSPVNGVRDLRAAIAGHLRSFRGMDVDPENIVIGAGTDHLYGLIVQLLGPERIYAVEDPGYSKIAEVYRSFRTKCIHIPLDEYGIRPDELVSANVGIVHVSPSHHFPTGKVMPAVRRHELLAWAAESEERYIIEDEYDSEFRMSGRPIPTLQSEDQLGRVIYMNTFTKTLAPTIRISYMILPPRLAQRYREQLSFYSCAVSNFEQYALARFIERGYFEKHINRMRKISRIRRDELLRCIADNPISGYVRIMEEEAGLHFLLYIDTAMSDAAFCKRALGAGIRLEPLSGYRNASDGEDEHIFIINYAGLKSEAVRDTVKRLEGLIIGR